MDHNLGGKVGKGKPGRAYGACAPMCEALCRKKALPAFVHATVLFLSLRSGLGLSVFLWREVEYAVQ